jgi:hypothetical protein
MKPGKYVTEKMESFRRKSEVEAAGSSAEGKRLLTISIRSESRCLHGIKKCLFFHRRNGRGLQPEGTAQRAGFWVAGGRAPTTACRSGRCCDWRAWRPTQSRSGMDERRAEVT